MLWNLILIPLFKNKKLMLTNLSCYELEYLFSCIFHFNLDTYTNTIHTFLSHTFNYFIYFRAYFTFFTPFFIYCIESVSQSSKSVSILQGTYSISKFLFLFFFLFLSLYFFVLNVMDLIYCKISGCLREIRLGYIAYRFAYYLAFPEWFICALDS
jgi:hypothetical protein